ncbi:MAG TPA: DUF3788 domain-containing protein [Draconibacterium sp.]|nr:DUF3788 domain-containing protein [Draconibacterium sp.]
MDKVRYRKTINPIETEMEDTSIFMDKAREPKEQDLKEKLGSYFLLWSEIQNFVFEQYPSGKPEWFYSGAKRGWSFRIKDKKRAIIYLLPRDGYFKVALVFGDKATEAILASDILEEIKVELKQAHKYAEGRGIRIEVKTATILDDIKKLIEIKLAN